MSECLAHHQKVPRVAVIIPCFNDGPLAIEAAHSVQEEEDIELVVVDDGSTDAETDAALAELVREGVAVIHRENKGVAAARMAGVAATSAPYIQPLDADDLLPRSSLSMLADALDSNPSAAFAYGDYEVFGNYNGIYRAPRQFSRWALTYTNPYCGCSLVRRSALGHVCGWSSATDYEDWDLWMQFAEAGYTGAYVPEVVYRRRLHEARRLDKARGKYLEAYQSLQKRHPQLFANRSNYRREEHPGLKQRLLYPLLLGERKYVPVKVENWLKRLMMRTGMRV